MHPQSANNDGPDFIPEHKLKRGFTRTGPTLRAPLEFITGQSINTIKNNNSKIKTELFQCNKSLIKKCVMDFQVQTGLSYEKMM